MKVYVITQGCYSDYHICAVATDEVKAEGLRKLFTDDSFESTRARIQVYDTDKFTTEADLANSGCKVYSVAFDAQGHFDYVDDYYTGDYVSVFNEVERYKNGRYGVYVMAKDEDHAAKIAQDLVAEYRYCKEVEEDV